MAAHASAAAHRAKRSPLQINISRLGRRPGSMLTVEETVASPSRLGGALVGVEVGAPLELHLKMESVSEGVLVSGTMSAPTTGECSRCLEPVHGQVDIELTELFAYPNSLTDETTDTDELGRVDTSGDIDTVDLEQPIIDAVGLVLPFSPLCGPDCAGLCPQCGIRLATAEPGHRHEAIDPRWARLASMFPDRDAEGSGEPE